jgi:hypothetical protein
MDFISNKSIGDQYGTLRAIKDGNIFVHPGLTTPTSFNFNLTAFATAIGSDKHHIEFEAAISPEVSQEAIARGGANVHIRFMSGKKQLAESIVTVGHPYQLNLLPSQYPNLRIIVDNNGSPDTDWLIFSAQSG